MTNPPFYISEEEMMASAAKKSRPPLSACTGAPVEMVCQGGELAFVGRILDESLVLRERVQWYTSMFGKVSSLEPFIQRLRSNGIKNYAVTEFIQGNKTRRWAIGWSFAAMRPSEDAARGLKAAGWKKILPPAVEVEVWTQPTEHGVGGLANQVDEIVRSLELMSWDWRGDKLSGSGRVRENVWSRAWRRRQLQAPKQESKSVESGSDTSNIFGFCVSLHVGRSDATIKVRWLEGHDETLFESFCGWLKRRLKT
jgi:23S rRNA (adenine1618-N6)-methyltransferase